MQTAADLITYTTLSSNLGPMTPTNIYDIIIWCRDYEKRNKFPLSIEKRFLVGIYQIYQGMNWKDNGVNKYEGYAASVCHLFMVAERLKVEVDKELNLDLKNFPHDFLECKEILYHISRASQQIIYGSVSYTLQRKSRFKKEILEHSLGKVIHYLIVAIPKELRTEAFDKASEIMTKGLK